VQCTGFENLEILKDCPNLQSLYLTNNSFLSDISALAVCTQLKSLRIDNCPLVSDISVLENCKPLICVELCKTAVTWLHLRVLKSLPHLWWVVFDDNSEVPNTCGFWIQIKEHLSTLEVIFDLFAACKNRTDPLRTLKVPETCQHILDEAIELSSGIRHAVAAGDKYIWLEKEPLRENLILLRQNGFTVDKDPILGHSFFILGV
jgi:hypothetical protein